MLIPVSLIITKHSSNKNSVTNLSHFMWLVGGVGVLNSNYNPLKPGTTFLPFAVTQCPVIGLPLTSEENSPSLYGLYFCKFS